MSIIETELISLDVVIVGAELLDSLEAVDRFGQSFYEYRWSPLNDASGGPGRRVSLDRDRIHIDLTPLRSTVRQEYPGRDGIPKLAEIVHQVLEHTEKPLANITAHGFNAEFSFSTGGVPAFNYIATRVLSGFPVIHDWQMAGASARMTFVDPLGVVRNISIEPRFMNERISRAYLNINLHFGTGGAPSKDKILAGFDQLIRDAESFLGTLNA